MNFKKLLKEAKTIKEVAEIRNKLDVLSEEWQEAEKELRNLLKEKYQDESVLVVRGEDVDGLFNEGFTKVAPLQQKEVLQIINDKSFFVPRYSAEFNPTFKQVIPYVVATTEEEEIFSLIRKSGDPRLVGNISIGVGGHINPVDDVDTQNKLMNGLERELMEEVEFGEDTYGNLYLLGFIYDSSNEVGRDHLGLIYGLGLSNKDIKVKETETLSGKFFKISELKNNVNKLENWSQIVLDNIL